MLGNYFQLKEIFCDDLQWVFTLRVPLCNERILQRRGKSLYYNNMLWLWVRSKARFRSYQGHWNWIWVLYLRSASVQVCIKVQATPIRSPSRSREDSSHLHRYLQLHTGALYLYFKSLNRHLFNNSTSLF